MSNSDITIACTSCGRFKLLKRTITSLEKNVDITWCKKIMTEDSKDAKHIEKMKKAQKDGFLKWWEIEQNFHIVVSVISELLEIYEYSQI